MASIAKNKNGTRRILFVHPDGRRPAVRLGKVSQRTAESVKNRVEQLLEALTFNRPMETDLMQWVAALEPSLAGKLARAGLIPNPEAKPAATLGPFLDSYIVGRTDVKPLTTRHLNDARRDLVAYFGEDKPLADVTPGDADDYRLHLLGRLGDNTVRRKCGRAKQFFRAAVRRRLIAENPFADMKGCGVQANRARDYFLTRLDAQKVSDACPDSQWRLLFALSRYGGLRCPSEHLALRWVDVDWNSDRFTVHSSKTEHHEGKGSRTVPIFPELRPYLNQVWDEAEPGTEFVITRYRDSNSNLRTTLSKIIRRAGLEPWPKLFHNLRATRETELAQTYPLHVVCNWIGNSTTVATKHYLQVTDGHFEQAITSNEKAAHNPAQSMHETSGNKQNSGPPENKKHPVLLGVSSHCDYLPVRQVPPDGLEPSTL